MKDLTGTTALTEKDNIYYRLVFLVEIDADEPDIGTTTQYLGSRKFTLSGQVYDDKLVPFGIKPGWSRLQSYGGFASVSGFTVAQRNEEKASALMDTYFLENDEVRVYVVFVTGSETSKIELARGVVEHPPYDVREWILDVIDGSDQDLREIPAEKVNGVDHPDAPFDAAGKVVPVPFGTLNVGPFDAAGADPLLASCRCTDKFDRQYTSGLQADVYGTPFQYYPQAARLAEVLAFTQTGGSFTIDDATRKLLLGPAWPKGTNDVSGWKAVADGDHTVGVAIVNLSNLDVYMSGVPKLGSLTAITMEIKASGSYDYTVYHGATLKVPTASATGNKSITLTAADHADDWDFELYRLEIDGTGAATINEIFLDLRYDDQQTVDRQGLLIFQKITGWEDLAAYYNDGAVISGSGDPLTNPAHQLEAIFRAKVLMNLAAAKVHLAALDTAATDRTGWAFAFTLDQAVSHPWLNEFGFQAGLHIIKDYQAKWKVSAQEKTKTPSHTFLHTHNLAIQNPQDKISEWLEDIHFGRTPIRDLINEIALRYRLDRSSGEYTALEVASGRYRVTGTCSTSTANKTLTDPSATFISDDVKVNETTYVQKDQDYKVTSVNLETELAITPVGGGDVTENAAGTTYWTGPNLDGRMLRSQQRYKTENALGQEQRGYVDQGGYPSDFIADAATATKFIERLIEWRSQRRLTVEFATYMNAVDVELGDACFIDHPWLETKKRPVNLSTLSLTVNSTTTTIPLQTGEAALWRDNDYFLLDFEICKVSSRDEVLDELTVTRGSANTIKAAHTNNAAVKRIITKWEITGILFDVERAQFRLEAQEMPRDYKPVGICSASGHPNGTAADAAELAGSGWALNPSGRLFEEDEFSDISYVGA